MAPRHEDVVVGRDELIAEGEDDRSTTESKDDAALLVSWTARSLSEEIPNMP